MYKMCYTNKQIHTKTMMKKQYKWVYFKSNFTNDKQLTKQLL